MRVWDGIGGYDPDRGSWTAWLTAVTRNTALNRLAEELPGDGGPLRAHARAGAAPEEALLERERREELRQAIARLPEKDLRPLLPEVLLYAVHGADRRRAGPTPGRWRGGCTASGSG